MLLTSIGLRRAAHVVGPKLWRSAAAPARWNLGAFRADPVLTLFRGWAAGEWVANNTLEFAENGQRSEGRSLCTSGR